MDKAVSIKNLTKRYKNNRGIENINIEINRGEIFGFLGPNGSGKTTTMKIMVGLMHPDTGNVDINGYSVTDNYENAMEDVGCIIEAVTPFPNLTACENMRLCSRYHNKVDNSRIEECLNLVGLLKYKNEKIKNYSLGMKQRIGIAIAILHNPKILKLDEPLKGLDVEAMVDMRNLILNLSQQHNTTFFISSHLIHDIELTCNKVGILYGGKLLNVDYTENILKNYSSLENYYLSEVGLNGKH